MFSSFAPAHRCTGQVASSSASASRADLSAGTTRAHTASDRVTVTNVSEVPLVEPPRHAGAATRPRTETARALPPLRLQPSDPDAPVGPPPTFERSYLERKRDMAHRLAAMHAAEAQAAAVVDGTAAAIEDATSPADAATEPARRPDPTPLLLLNPSDRVAPSTIDRRA